MQFPCGSSSRKYGSKRASYEAVKDAIADTDGECSGGERSWRHTLSVDGAEADFSADVTARFGFRVTAGEGATFRAGIFRARGRRGPAEPDRAAISAALAPGGASSGIVSRAAGGVKAYWQNDVEFGARTLRPGRYVYAVRLASETNPARTVVFVGKPFRVR